MENGNLIVFTDWNRVVITTKNENGENICEKSISNYLKYIEKLLHSNKYNVLYDSVNKKFTIIDDGIYYDVLLPDAEEESLITGNYTSLALSLLLLAIKEKKYNDQDELKRVKEAKINAIIDSDYEDMGDIEDQNMYLEYLKESLKYANTKEEKNTIKTKILYLSDIILKEKKEREEDTINPLRLQNRTLYLLFELICESKRLSLKDREMINNKIKKVLLDYRKTVLNYYNSKKNTLVVGKPTIQFSTLRQIVEIEEIIRNLYLKGMNNIISELSTDKNVLKRGI